jgi:hypothetical protein
MDLPAIIVSQIRRITDRLYLRKRSLRGFKSVRENCPFAPSGLVPSHFLPHGLRRGLHSDAASRLKAGT